MAARSSTVAATWLLLATFCWLYVGEAAQCVPDEINPCVARCNYTAFDLSKAFNFPINITEPRPRSDGRTYWYMWSPCESYHCPGYLEKTDCAVCQKADAHWCCGQTSRPIFKWDTYSHATEMPVVPRPTFPGYTIEYTFGSGWRIAIFQFVIDNKVEEPVVEFISEDPYLQYNFRVTGKCIGQFSSECTQYYTKMERLELDKQVDKSA